MSKFEELNNNMNSILLKLTSSQKLCKYLHYDSDSPQEEADIPNTDVLLFSSIFPLPTVEFSATTEHSYLLAAFDNIKLSSNIRFKEALLRFDIVCHTNLWNMPGESKLRPYSIANEIDELINEQRGLGIGKVQFEEAKILPINEQYSGYRVTYKLYDFN
ncbi:MAG: hypothetical protein K0Q73_6210 [Paenibacillus sp.]|nr:hypothetical protein [Paenibacillus sp.]